MMTKAEDISNRPTRKGCRTLCAAALCLFLLFCQLFVQSCGNVRENLQLVGLHQQLVAGTGVEDAVGGDLDIQQGSPLFWPGSAALRQKSKEYTLLYHK